MNANQVLSTGKQILGYIGIALAVIALAKLFGFRPPIPGSVDTLALVAIACLLSR